ncbi:MAG: tetratricopeptide repeat protein [Candidatus Krumholzibacteria bacterium]|nr:tetratricopeptide repeat protein [Candidatus Krumholzibacteria bacterium]
MTSPLYYYVIIGAVLVLVIAGAVVVIRRKRGTKTATDPYVEALKLMVDGHADGAFLKLQEAVKEGGAPTDAYIRLGNLLRNRGEASKALQIHQSLTVKANLSKPEKIELYLSLAEDHAKLGNSERSVKVLETAIRNLNIKDADVSLTLAKHHHLLGASDRAYEALKDAAKLGGIGDRELALYMTSSAEEMVEKGELKDARKLLQRALRHDAGCAPGLLLLGNIAERSKNLADAIGHWKQVALISPQLAASALHKLESTLYEQGRFGDIEKIYNEVREARVGDEAAVLALAAFYKKQDRGEEAMQLLEEFLTLYPESVPVYLLLTSFYARHRDPQTLERFLDESIKDPWLADHFECRSCNFKSDRMRWHCPRCNSFDSFSSNHEAHA